MFYLSKALRPQVELSLNIIIIVLYSDTVYIISTHILVSLDIEQLLKETRNWYQLSLQSGELDACGSSYLQIPCSDMLLCRLGVFY